MIHLADLKFESEQFREITEKVFERILSDEDKQYQIDVTDMIEDYIYQINKMMESEKECHEDEEVQGHSKFDYITFLNTLIPEDSIDEKNLLLENLYREVVNRGNYLGIEGRSLCVQDCMKDLNTDNLYKSLNLDANVTDLKKLNRQV